MKKDFVDTMSSGITVRLFKWSLRRMFKLHSPGHAMMIMNKEVVEVAEGYGSRFCYGVYVSAWIRGARGLVNVVKTGAHDKENIECAKKLLKHGLRDLEGKALHVRNIL